MNPKTMFILGGYGNTGRLIAEYLLPESDCRIVLAGRSLKKAEALAAELNRQHEGGRVSAAAADAGDAEGLRRSLAGADMVIVASSTSEYVETVARAALDVGADYLDVQYSTAKLATLQALTGEIEAAGRCFISDGGFHPGLPAAMVHYAAPQFDRLHSAKVGSVIKIDWAALEFSPATMQELVLEFMDYQPLEFKAGKWRKMNMWTTWKPDTMDYGGVWGEQMCVPMFLEEMRSLPETYPDLRQTGFFVGSFNPVVDYLILPLVLPLMKLSPDRFALPAGRLMTWGLKRFSKPPFGTLLKLEAKGEKEGKPHRLDLILSHADGYAFTAIPVVACLLHYLDQPPRPGLWLQAHYVEPQRLLRDIERLGVGVQVEIS